MYNLQGKKILLGITGGIAAYKSLYLVRELVKLGAEVKIILTESAQQFVTPMSLQALSQQEVRSALFDANAERAMSHIELARWADILLIAPASANFLAKMAHGLADCLLSTACLVAENIPIIVCPAMNHSMWSHAATKTNCSTLSARGIIFVGPEEGAQACGEYGPGRLAETTDILNALCLNYVTNLLAGCKLVITAGPTLEKIDPVRFLTNHSSGKMGYALAAAAQIAGAEVTLISGPTHLAPPSKVKLINITSAKELQQQVIAELSPESIFISCAAVCDYRPSLPADNKIKKSQQDGDVILQLSTNPDIIGEVAKSKLAKYCVAFAAETENLIANATDKLKSKQVDMVIANLVGENKVFNSDDNCISILTANETLNLPQASKLILAGEILRTIASELGK